MEQVALILLHGNDGGLLEELITFSLVCMQICPWGSTDHPPWWKTSWPSFVPLSAHRCCASTICLHSDGDKDRRTMKAGYQVAVLLALLSLLNFCWWQSLTWSLIFSSYDWSGSKNRGLYFGEACTPVMYFWLHRCKALINSAGMLLYFISFFWYGLKKCTDWNNINAASFLRLRHHHSCSLWTSESRLNYASSMCHATN